MLDEVHGLSVPLFKTVYDWMIELKPGRTSTRDEPRLGRPVEITTLEMIGKIQE